MNKKTFISLFSAVVIVNFAGLLCNIFSADSSMYAMISKSLVTSGNYWDLFVYEKDWLDKPHFPFWVCALSIEIFGSNTFAYKIPSILFFFMGLGYTYKLAKRLYGYDVAQSAVLIMGSSLHLIISNNDTRAEAILLGLVMGAVYYTYLLSASFSIRNLILAAGFCGAAVMTKGVFVLVIIYSAVLFDVWLKKDFGKLISIRWPFLFAITMIFTLPELYAVYQQFDLHPEKIVFGNTNVSGLQFFLWDSQLGRFFNSGPIKGKGDPTFFIHTMLWAFAPWAILGFTSLYKTARAIIGKKQVKEYVTFFGFLVMFIVFSVSSFQLAHYTNIIFPFLAISVGALLIGDSENKIIVRITNISINVYAVAAVLAIGLVEYLFQPEYFIIGLLIMIGLIAAIILFNTLYSNIKYRGVIFGTIVGLLLGAYLNTGFYPGLLKYQSGSQVAFIMKDDHPSADLLVAPGLNYYDLQYYSSNKIVSVDEIDKYEEWMQNGKNYVFSDDEFMSILKKEGFKYSILNEFDHFRITKLNKKFLDVETRSQKVKKRYLLEVTI
ncbi:MAG: glycosyltransferase family 39 protein [Flavobacteriales bacterium]|nr:glycosyltransferase family 39 protein [Flavobacteriales bacterium]